MKTQRIMLWGGAFAAAALTASAVPAAAAPTTAPAAPARCAGSGDVAPGSTAVRTVISGERMRSYRIHVPSGAAAGIPLPVVLGFHGRGSTGAELQAYSGLSGLPAVTVFPEGLIGTGDGDRQAWQGAPYAAPGVDDVAFVRAVLDDLPDRACIDTRRIYATGKSNGAGFVNILACRLPDRIAAIAPVAAAVYPGVRAACSGTPTVPALIMHGDADATIPYGGDAERGLPTVETWARQWAAHVGCRGGEQSIDLAEDVSGTRFRGCGPRPVELITVRGDGHTWPGALAYSGGGRTTQSVKATALAWSFFSATRPIAATGDAR